MEEKQKPLHIITINDIIYNEIFFLGEGTYGNVYLVQENNAPNVMFTVKIYKDTMGKRKFRHIIEILNIISNLNNPYIIKNISNGECDIESSKGIIYQKQYFAYEYALKGTLLYYFVEQNEPNLEEKYAIILFKNISKAIQAMHNNNICHRDIKLDNILLDTNYSPKICDFGSVYKTNRQTKSIEGTPQYAAPEVKRGKLYYGDKVDIYSLGITLIKLVLGIRTNVVYEDLQNKERLNLLFEKANISNELKELLLKMININPKERPTINEILDYPLLSNVNENDPILINDYYGEFEKREQHMVEKTKKKYDIHIESIPNKISSSNKSGSNNYKDYFTKGFKLRIIDDNMIKVRDYIKMNGDINPLQLMNHIANNINAHLEEIIEEKNACTVFTSSNNYYKLKISIEYLQEEENENEENEKDEEEEVEKKENEDEEDEEDEDEEEKNYSKKVLKRENLMIRVILLKSVNGYHLIRFYKKSGEFLDFYDKMQKIIEIIKKSLNID